MTPHIDLAFRFHGNFYHSFRGDTPDERGFGKDIRIIRHIIETLDSLNSAGIPVRGTWDFENYFSLELIMPVHCPDLIAGLQRRVREAGDEMELMSYNNGLINAHTAREFEASIGRGVTNANGSGLADLFGAGFRSIVRPQEMMYTPVHLKLYPACGIDTISLYYSALPFNGFSSFVPPLTVTERYNPLTLTYPGIAETMTLIPCYSVGDLADHLTLRRWVKQMRRQQLALQEPTDLLLLIDMDADDEFWVGYDVPLLKGRFSTVSGLRGLVESVADLDYLEFATPGEYLDRHAPAGRVTFGQDTADGSFDGHSSWAEKWSNHVLWTGLERARILELQTRRLVGGEMPARIRALLDESFEARLKVLSTTHFGMAAPVMNLTRESRGRDLVGQAVETAAAAFDVAAGGNRAAEGGGSTSLSLLDYVRGVPTELISYQAHPSRSLIRLRLAETAPQRLVVRSASGDVIPSAILQTGERRELLFVESFEPNERKDYRLEDGETVATPAAPVVVRDGALENESVQVHLDGQGHVAGVRLDGDEFALDRFLSSGLTYTGRRYEVERWAVTASAAPGVVGVMRLQGAIRLKGGFVAEFERELILAAGLPCFYVRTRVAYPRTPDRRYAKGKARRLEQAWDGDWQEVRPCEIFPALAGRPERPLRVWKHNYCDHVSTFSLDYGRFSKNEELDSANNQITHGWVAVSDGERGLLVAQSADVSSGMAFCPLRTRSNQGGAMHVRLNPFGTYWGRQYHYAIADTGLGNFLATTFSASDHINSYAPSYNGRVQEFSLLIAPYRGDAPLEALQYAAEAFAYPFAVLGDERFIAAPAHRGWEGVGLGEAPG